jgi:hypothetical protein
MAVRPCIVSFSDAEGLRHSVEVQAESLYEAAVLALQVFGAHHCCPGPAARIDVEVRTSVIHTVTVRKIKEWLDGGARGPAERILKNRLKERLVGLRS